MNQTRRTVRLLMLLILSTALLLGACTQKPKVPKLTCERREEAGDVCLSQHAGTYVEAFLKDYPNMEVTKVRWQMLPNGVETYIIEGNDGKTKSIVKYLMGDMLVLGRTERAFLEEEIENSHCIEKPLDLPNLLTFSELHDVAEAEMGGRLHELRIEWKDDTPVAFVEVIDDKYHFNSAVICALSGKFLY